jgi:hypothetical protein
LKMHSSWTASRSLSLSDHENVYLICSVASIEDGWTVTSQVFTDQKNLIRQAFYETDPKPATRPPRDRTVRDTVCRFGVSTERVVVQHTNTVIDWAGRRSLIGWVAATVFNGTNSA